MTKAYRVSFLKEVLDSTGHTFHAAQGTIDVRATSQTDAIKEARRTFAAIKGTNDWSFHADYETVQEITPTPRVKSQATNRAGAFDAESPRSVANRKVREVAQMG